MAGIGITLNRIFSKNTIGMNVVGYSYSVVTTIAPMFFVIGNVLLMNVVFGTSSLSYSSRQLFAATVLYMFIFSLLTASPWNAVLSRYLSDVIYEERYEDILPCFYLGLLINMITAVAPAVPFCIHEYLVSGVSAVYIFTGFFGYLSISFIFYAMIYLSITKDYSKISLFYLIGMAAGFGIAALRIFVFDCEVMYSMLLGLSAGFLVTAALEFAQIRHYFKESSNNYRPVFTYLKNYRSLILANFLYTLGLFAHNFVFWTTDLKIVVVHSFVMAEPYDMATCLAMFTNISASTIFISLIEMHFHGRYRDYFNAVIGGSLMQIEKAKKRMFRQLVTEVMSLARIQFIITVAVFLVMIIVLPMLGFGGLIMQIYPCMSAAYFVVFLMYSSIILLYYFNDHVGLLLTTGSFCAVTIGGSILVARFLTPGWYGLGLWVGAVVGWVISYIRMRWLEKHIDIHVFCQGRLLEKGQGKMPSPVVYRKGQKVS